MVKVTRKPHPKKQEKTRSITYRFSEHLVDELETEAMEQNISQNVLVKQILEKYIEWYRFSEKIGMIPVPKKILQTLGDGMSGKDIDKIINVILPIIKDNVMFMKGGYDLNRCIETFEDYMKASGMKSDHRVEGALHKFIIQHDLGVKWSVFTEQLLTQVFRSFFPDQNLKFETTDTTVILTVALGTDFDEHEY